MSFDIGHFGTTTQGIKYLVVKQLYEDSFVVKLTRDKMESHKIVSLGDLKNKKIFFEEDFLIGDRNDSKKFNKNTSRS